MPDPRFDPDDYDQIVLPGRALAKAWLAVALACSNIEEQHALYRTVLFDVHPLGVTLASTDSYWMARAFVPFDVDDQGVVMVPTLDEVPIVSFVLRDTDWRARDLMRFVHAITVDVEKKNAPDADVQVAITRNVDWVDESNTPVLDASLLEPAVFVELPGQERIVAREFEGGFPNLARLLKFNPKSATKLQFSPYLMARASQAVQRIGASGVQLTPTKGGAVVFDAVWHDSAAHRADLAGLLMPIRDETDETPS